LHLLVPKQTGPGITISLARRPDQVFKPSR
jgi:hypothetical protein